MGKGDRWLTVCPPDQPDLDIVLSPVTRGIFSNDTAALLKELVEKGTFGMAVFTCRDIFATYEELRAKEVEFTKAPKKNFTAPKPSLKMIRETGFPLFSWIDHYPHYL